MNLTKDEIIRNYDHAIYNHVCELADEGEIESANYFENNYFQLVDANVDKAKREILLTTNKQFRGNKYETREEVAAMVVAYALDSDADECLNNIIQVRKNTVLVRY